MITVIDIQSLDGDEWDDFISNFIYSTENTYMNILINDQTILLADIMLYPMDDAFYYHVVIIMTKRLAQIDKYPARNMCTYGYIPHCLDKSEQKNQQLYLRQIITGLICRVGYMSLYKFCDLTSSSHIENISAYSHCMLIHNRVGLGLRYPIVRDKIED